MKPLRDFSHVRRVVIKVGTNLLSSDSGVNLGFIDDVCAQVARIRKQGFQVVLVSSGAIGIGARMVSRTSRVQTVKLRQACAAIGQPHLMHHYSTICAKHGIITSQILLTPEVFKNRRSYLNTRNAFETLLGLGVLPICNENDCVSTTEIGNAFGDNDRLSALIASKIDADLLIILSDVEGLYSANPKLDAQACLIDEVPVVDDAIVSIAGEAGSSFATGGMRTKIDAVMIASQAGCISVIASGRREHVIEQIMNGDPVGTLFIPGARASQRSRWILNAQPSGRILVDEGAVRALRNSKSLLPSGITAIEGSFPAGAVVMINDIAKAVPSFDSSELRSIMGRHSRDIRDLTGADRRDVVARPEDIVFLAEQGRSEKP